MLSRQIRYWYQRGHGGAPGVLRFALRQWYTCEPAASILSASDRKVLASGATAHQMHRKVARLVLLQYWRSLPVHELGKGMGRHPFVKVGRIQAHR